MALIELVNDLKMMDVEINAVAITSVVALLVACMALIRTFKDQ